MTELTKGKKSFIKKVQIIGIIFVVLGLLFRFECIPIPDHRILILETQDSN